MQKPLEKTFDISVVLFKKRLKKQLIFKKRRRFCKLANTTIVQRLPPFQNNQFGSEIKTARNIRCTSLQQFYSYSMREKRVQKCQYSKNQTNSKIGKNGHQAKASLGQKIKLPKTCKKRLYNHITFVLRQEDFEKTANIREMKEF